MAGHLPLWHPLALAFLVLVPLWAAIPSLCQQPPLLAQEFVPLAGGGKDPQGQQPSGAGQTGNAPTEEDLISKLLKSGPGLPPSGPPAANGEEGDKAAKEGNQQPAKEEGEVGGKEPAATKGSPQQPSSPPVQPQSAVSPPSFQPLPQSTAASPAFAAGDRPPAAPPSYIQCLHHIAAKLCDPEAILSPNAQREIDETLGELEKATQKENAGSECERSGLELMVILVRHSSLLDDPMNSVQKKLNEALSRWVQDGEHKCEKPVILMLSTDARMMNRRVWTGRHWDVPVDPGQLVQLYLEQEELTRKEKYSDVILNIIEGVLTKFERSETGAGI